MIKSEAKTKIQKAMKNGGNFCNNIVGPILREYGVANGYDKSDELVREMGLDKSLGLMVNGVKKQSS